MTYVTGQPDVPKTLEQHPPFDPSIFTDQHVAHMTIGARALTRTMGRLELDVITHAVEFSDELDEVLGHFGQDRFFMGVGRSLLAMTRPQTPGIDLGTADGEQAYQFGVGIAAFATDAIADRHTRTVGPEYVKNEIRAVGRTLIGTSAESYQSPDRDRVLAQAVEVLAYPHKQHDIVASVMKGYAAQADGLTDEQAAVRALAYLKSMNATEGANEVNNIFTTFFSGSLKYYSSISLAKLPHMLAGAHGSPRLRDAVYDHMHTQWLDQAGPPEFQFWRGVIRTLNFVALSVRASAKRPEAL